MANNQTNATAKWQEKAGYCSKSFKIKKSLADQFKAKCDELGVSQASQICKMMKEFIDNN